MDLDLSLGPPLPGRPPRALHLGLDLALASPAPIPPSPLPSSSPSSSGGESLVTAPLASMANRTSLAFPARLAIPCTFFPDSAPRGHHPLECPPYPSSYTHLAPTYPPVAPPPPPPFQTRSAFHPASFVQVLPADHVSGLGLPLHMQYEPRAPTGAEEVAPGGGNAPVLPLPHDPYAPPPLQPLTVIPEDRQEAAYAQRPLFSSPSFTSARPNDGSAPRPRFFARGIRLRRLLALHRSQFEGSPLRTPSPEGDERPSSSPPMRSGDSDRSEASTEISGKNKAGTEGINIEAEEDDEEDRGRNAVNFECNICLELAKEPVVTPCGHLFCWACLFQWLYLHCNYNECPVCKGEVVESEITPIYGRGSSESQLEEVDGVSGLRIPPRPPGRRSESWRQRVQRPISRRFSLGIATSWRRLLGEEVRHLENVIDDPALQHMFGAGSTSRSRGLTRAGDDMESGYFSARHPSTLRAVSAFRQNGVNSNPNFRSNFNEIWAHVSSDGLERGGDGSGPAAVGPYTSYRTDDNVNLGGAVRRSPVVSSRGVGQASASSTMAVIQGDVSMTNAVAETDMAGSSRNPRIRGRSSGLYADGSSVHACKGRRLN